MSAGAVDRALATVRTGTAALAIGVAALLLLRVPLIGTFRGALVLLAALEVLAFGHAALSRATTLVERVTLLVKLAVLAAAYAVLAG